MASTAPTHNYIPGLSCCNSSLTNLKKGNFGISSSNDFWNILISLNVLVHGLNLHLFLSLPSFCPLGSFLATSAFPFSKLFFAVFLVHAIGLFCDQIKLKYTPFALIKFFLVSSISVICSLLWALLSVLSLWDAHGAFLAISGNFWPFSGLLFPTKSLLWYCFTHDWCFHVFSIHATINNFLPSKEPCRDFNYPH